MVGILTSIASLAGTWLEGKQKQSAAKATAAAALEEAKAEVFKRKATSEQDWDFSAMEGSHNSWKDEYLTLVLSIPLLLCFVPGMEDVVRNGFAQLDSVPDWYKGAFAVVVSASFGVRSFMKFWKR